MKHTFDGVREMAGVFSTGSTSSEHRQWIEVRQRDGTVAIEYPKVSNPIMTPDEARRLGRIRIAAANRAQSFTDQDTKP